MSRKVEDDMDKWDEVLSYSGMGQRCELRTALKNCLRFLEKQGLSEQAIRQRIFHDVPLSHTQAPVKKDYSDYSIAKFESDILALGANSNGAICTQSLVELDELLNVILEKFQETNLSFYQKFFSCGRELTPSGRALVGKIKRATLNIISTMELKSLTDEVNSVVARVKKIMSTDPDDTASDDRYLSFLHKHEILLECRQLALKAQFNSNS